MAVRTFQLHKILTSSAACGYKGPVVLNLRGNRPFLIERLRDGINHNVKSYSDWYRKRPTQSQFVADLEGEPYRTRVTLENISTDSGYLYVDSYSTFGFKLSNGFRILGPCALFPKTALHWNVTGSEDIHLHSLSLFTVLEPKLDLLIIGVGEQSEIKYVNRELYRDLKSKGIGLELLSTHNAAATFNFLSSEKRCVAAALLPPKKIISRNVHEFYLPENYESMGSMLTTPDMNIDPQTQRRIEDEEEDEEGVDELESSGYWDDGVPKPLDSKSQHKLDNPDKNNEPKLPDGKTKS